MTALLTPPAPGIQLRHYQQAAVTGALRQIASGKKAPLIVSPTGTGKMVVAAAILERAYLKGNTALFAVHRREMVKQCSEKLTTLGVPHSLVMPGHQPSNMERVYVGTVQSFGARMRRGSFDPLNVRVIVIDEAHHATAQSYRTLIEAYPNAVVVGLTATPCRADGTGLGNVFDALVQGTTYSAALEEGYLVKPRYYAPYTPDLSDVTTRAGDYAEDDLEREMNQPQLVGDIVQHYAKLAADRQGIVFATRVRHSLALCAEFIRAGFTAFHIDGTTPTDERDELMQQFRDGDLQIMVNVGVATEGLDVPNVGAVVLARPTKSVSLHMQMIGRGLRPAEGKDSTLILDHAGNTVRLGPVEIRESWSLDQKKGKSKKKKDREPKEITCDECSAIFYGTRTCPQCGHIHEYERAPLDMEVVDGELVEIGEEPMVYTTAMKQGFYRMLLHYADNHGKKPGWAYHTYKARWGVYPTWGSGDHRVHPSPEVIAWINGYLKQQRIAWAKRQEKIRKIEQLDMTGE